MDENHSVHFPARSFNKNSPMLRISMTNPQSEYGRPVFTSAHHAQWNLINEVRRKTPRRLF